MKFKIYVLLVTGNLPPTPLYQLPLQSLHIQMTFDLYLCIFYFLLQF